MNADRLPPYSSECECGVLGCILEDPQNRLGEAVETLAAGADTFYDLRHKTIFEAMLKLSYKNIPVDLVSLYEILRKSEQSESVGGLSYLSTLQDSVPSAANLPYYVATVNDHYVTRQVIAVCTNLVHDAYASENASTLLDQMERDVMAIRPKGKSKGNTVRELVAKAIVQLDDLWHHQGHIEGLPTGLTDLDQKTGGLHNGEVTVIAGFPGSGKTSLAMNIAENAMINCRKKVGVFSLEMSPESLVIRFICSHAKVNLRNLPKGVVTEQDFLQLKQAADQISGAAVWFEHHSDLSVLKLRSKARRMMQEHGLDLVIIDYLQLLTSIDGNRKVESRQQEVADISRGIKALAQELNVPVVVLSQLNDDGKLRESRAIGQDADNVWILRPKEEGSEDGTTNLLIAKARNGPTGNVQLLFRREFTRFESIAKIDVDD